RKRRRCTGHHTHEEWLGPESNRRHVDFQSTALPTELPSRFTRENRPFSVRFLPPSIFAGDVILTVWNRFGVKKPKLAVLPYKHHPKYKFVLDLRGFGRGRKFFKKPR